ncbi:MAG: phytanoyl-CoA dioxygenase family protein [Planctomycetota bacterium]|nr:phytanoyl-CoA dioxygenase family protein [Planctomycetota bacterium]
MTGHVEFARDGFVRREGFLGAAAVAALDRELRRFLDEVLPSVPEDQVYCEVPGDRSTLKQIQQLGRHDDTFAALLNDSPFSALAAELLDAPVLGRNLQFFDKPSGEVAPTPAHQDGAYFALEPMRAVTLWLALDDVEEDQGCLTYAAGSHQLGLRAHAPSGVLGFSRGIEDYDPAAEDERAQPCRAGDLCAHHAFTIHRADANQRPGRARRSLGFIYYDATAVEDRAAADRYQRELSAGLRGAGRLG